ncbi:hypothetical protein [Streptomyces sp. NBC_00576]|uniref:hypothetical protein n=1 Tax=Streptomyces sp. NBC_00576 TaxID=2903665 RepID=UPI002E80A960|nr:hypothetical protein [Streptomyces sp. NBC_00576]WUB74144.1 hypothetical protein OG734_31030 [Streptomyces sp. NBC_00576]
MTATLTATATSTLTTTLTATMTAALIATPGALSAPAHAATCATTPTDRTFPLTTRIHGGPTAYEAGGEHRTWRLDLTNNTARTCTDIHPVLVLVDERRALTTTQPRLEFYDGHRPRPYPVRFEATDADETIGVFDGDGFPGFTVGPGRTVSVEVRLAIDAGAVANDIVANAAVIQRHADDGDWVGQSNDYRFRVVAPAPTSAPASTSAPTSAPTSAASASADPASPRPVPGVQDGLPYTGELAGTGRREAALRLGGIAFVLLLTGGGVLLLVRVRGVGRT